VALSVAWQTVFTNITTTTALYTTPSASTAAYGSYARDLVITSSGASTLFVSAGPAAASAVTTSSFGIPSGGSVILTQCQVPAGTIIYGVSAGTAAASIGWATNVNYF
jgi:hypothetical protein